MRCTSDGMYFFIAASIAAWPTADTCSQLPKFDITIVSEIMHKTS